MIPKEVKPVLVIWSDASVEIHKDYDEPHEYEVTTMYSVGILGAKNKAGVILYQDYEPASKSYATKLCIPNGMVMKIIRLPLPPSYSYSRH
jgi:hypothetical protein